MNSRTAVLIGAMVILFATLLLTGCEQNMVDQPKYEPYEDSRWFPDHQAARRLVDGTVARGTLLGPPPNTIPFPITQERLNRGQERFTIFCSPCHGLVGDGEGMVVQRGFPQPPSFHQERLRKAPDAHFYHVISEGYGVMYSYAARVPPADRWAITAYIRALQLSQHASLAELPANAPLPKAEVKP